MSREVDERVVSMQFDNKQFEANVATTMSTLDKLEAKLNFKGAGKALDELNDSARNVDFSHMGNAVESIELKFSAMSVAAIAAINRIVNSAFDAGEQLVKSLSIDQITAGWEKYGEKTTAVQTIMAATGESIDYVNEQLEKMNWFTDETSFNFTDMTNNVGKFTSAGVDLEKAVLAMQGIATEAALSGQNAQSASRAMYNFSQALGTGSVKVQDWMSIENANMATKEFKETIIETAKELGRVSETGEILAITSAKYSGDEFVNFSNFRSTLAAGWFDSDVLIKSLEKYGSFATKLQEITDTTGTTATEMLRYVREYESGATDIGKISKITGVSVEELSGYMETLTSKEYELGRKAFQAAQEAKTLREAIDATKDAVSTGWMNTFELLFGNYEEAKTLWTKLSEDLWEIFASGGEGRNELLSQWNEEFEGRTMLIEGLSGAMDRLIEIIGLVRDAFNTVFPPMTAKRLAEITKSFRDLILSVRIFEEDGETLTGTGQTIYTVFHSIAEAISVFTTALGTVWDIAKGVLGAFGDAVKEVFEPLSDDLLTKATTKMKNFIKSLKPGENAFKNLSKIFKLMLTPVKGLLDILGALADTLLNLIPSTEKVGTVLERVFGSERYTRLTEGLGKIIDRITSLFSKLADKVSSLFKKNEFGEDSPLSKFLKNVYAILEPIATWMLDKIVEGVEALAALDWNTILGSIEENLGKIHTKITDIVSIVTGFFTGSKTSMKTSLLGITDIDDAVSNLKLDFSSFKKNNNLTTALTTLKNDTLSGLSESLGNIGSKIGEFVRQIDPAKVAVVGFGGALTAALIGTTSLMGSMSGMFKTFSSSLTNVTTGVTGILTQLKTNLAAQKPKSYEKLAKALLILVGAVVAIALINPERLKTSMTAMLGLMGAFTAMVGIISAFGKMLGPQSMIAFDVMSNGFVKLAGAVAILSVSLLMLNKLNVEQLGDKVLALGAIIVAFGVVAGLLGKYVPSMTANSIGFIAFAGAIALIIHSLKELDGLDLTGMGDSIIALLGVFVAVAAIAKLGAKGSFSGALGMIVTIGSIMLLVSVLKKLSEVRFEEIQNGLLPMIGLMTIVILVSKAVKNAGRYAAQAGVAAVLIAASTLILVETIRQIGELPLGEAIKGTVAVMGLIFMLALVCSQLAKTSSNASKAGTAILLMSVAILILSKTIDMLGGLPLKNVAVGVAAVTLILGMFALIIALSGQAGKVTGTIVSITAAIATIAAAIALLAQFEDPNDVLKVALGMSAIMLAFAGVTKIMTDIKWTGVLKAVLIMGTFVAAMIAVMYLIKSLSIEGKEKTFVAFGAVILALTGCVALLTLVKPTKVSEATGTLAEMALLAAAGAGVIWALTKLPEDTGIVEKASGFALAVVAVSGAAAILSKVNPTSIKNVLAGIADLTLVVAAVGGIIFALGALIQDEKALAVMEKGSAAFSLIGEAIGSFVGNVIGGLVGGIISGFNVSVMDSMATIAEKLKEFMNTVGGIQSASIENFKGVMEALLLLTAAKFINGIGLFTNAVKEWKDLGKGLDAFKKSFIPFLKDISESNISYARVKTATTAMEGIAELVNAIPGGLSIKTAWTGVKNLSSFGEELEKFAPHFKAYMDEINNITVNDEANKAVVAAATTVAEFAKITPKEDGILQAIMGKNIHLDEFGKQLEDFAPHFKKYVDEIKTVDVKDVDKYTAPIETLVKIAGLIPKDTSDTWVSSIFGTNVNMDNFGYNLAMFGLWFKIYAGHLAEISQGVDIVGVTENIVDATIKIIEMSKLLDKEGGWLGDTFGDNSTAFTRFGQNLTEYGRSIAAFYETVSKIKPDFTDIIQEFTNAGSQMILSFIGGMSTNLTPAKEKAFEIVNACLTHFNNIQNETTMKQAGNSFTLAFKDGIKNSSDEVEIQANACAAGAINGLKTTLDIREGTNPYSNKTRSIGKQVVEGMRLGIGDSESKLLTRINTMGANVVAALKKKLDIKSPSRVMRDEIGVFIPQGIAEGIEKDNSAEFAARDKAAQIVNAVSQAFAAIENSEDFSPTITPVLNLSEIQNGAKSINGIIDTNAQLSFGASANLRAISAGFNSIQNPLATPPQNIVNNYGQAITADQLAMAVKDALNGAGVFMDGRRVGDLITIQQRRAAMAMGN